jgi:Xaa-Pro aminopeptidase
MKKDGQQMTEFGQRLSKLQAAVDAAGVDLVAIGPMANMHYLVGFTPHADERLCLLLISAQAISAVVPKLNAAEWSAHTDIPPHIWPDDEGPHEALEAALLDMPPVKKLAIDGAMRADFLLPLMAATTPQEIIPVESLIASLRSRKSLEEIEALSRAAAQADRAMQAAIDACQPGVAEASIAWAAEEAFRLDGAEEVCFTLVASGPNGAHPHHHSGSRLLQHGDAIIIDIGASLGGYKSDITRMAFLGEPSTEFLKAYHAVLEANERARSAVQPGITAQELDQVARGTLDAAGYAEYFVHRTGHGLGLEIHEPPWIMAGNEQVLEEGMVFSVEPGVYIPGQFGVRIEDIVVVTETGVRTLTGFDRQLVIKQ